MMLENIESKDEYDRVPNRGNPRKWDEKSGLMISITPSNRNAL